MRLFTFDLPVILRCLAPSVEMHSCSFCVNCLDRHERSDFIFAIVFGFFQRLLLSRVCTLPQPMMLLLSRENSATMCHKVGKYCNKCLWHSCACISLILLSLSRLLFFCQQPHCIVCVP